MYAATGQAGNLRINGILAEIILNSFQKILPIVVRALQFDVLRFYSSISNMVIHQQNLCIIAESNIGVTVALRAVDTVCFYTFIYSVLLYFYIQCAFILLYTVCFYTFMYSVLFYFYIQCAFILLYSSLWRN